MLAYYVACSDMMTDKSFPAAFKILGNTTFARIYEQPKKYKTLQSSDVYKDDQSVAYGGCLETVDSQLHSLFLTESDVNKIRYTLLNKHADTSSSSTASSIAHHLRRRILPLHIFRNTGEVRTSVNEIARAIKHHWELTNVVGIGWTQLQALYHKYRPQTRRTPVAKQVM